MVATPTGTRISRPRMSNTTPRRKRRDTHVGTIERELGLDFGVRSDMHLGTLLQRRNAAWLEEILRQAQAGDDEPEADETEEFEEAA